MLCIIQLPPKLSFSGVVGSSLLKLPSSFLASFLVFLDFLSSSNFTAFILYQTFMILSSTSRTSPSTLFSSFPSESYFRLIFLFSSYNLNYKCYSEKRSTLRHFIFSIISCTYYSNRHSYTSQSYISLD